MNRQFFSKPSIIAEILGYVFCLAAFIVAIVGVATRKELPINYDSAGNFTRYGSPAILFVTPAIMLAANGSMSLMFRFTKPGTWNMPFAIRRGRELRVLRDLVLMIMLLELLCGSFSFVFTLMMFLEEGGAIVPAVILFVAALLGDIVIMTAVASKHNKGGL